MIVYVADRQLSILAAASTHLREGLRIIDDSKTDSLETGTKTFSCTIIADSREQLRFDCAPGNYLLRSSEDENEFYTIIETELNSDNKTLTLYAEDAGLDLLNVQVPAYKAPAAHDMEWYVNKYLTDYASDWAIGLNEAPDSTQTLEFESESTLTERLLSIAGSFGCEVAYSYDIEGLNVTAKYIDIYEKRGNKAPERVFYLNREITSITEKQSIEELATALDVKGQAKASNKAVTLQGADYSSDGTTTHSPAVETDDYQIQGTYVICKSAISNWKSVLDTDGVLVRPYQYDTDNKKTLFDHAVAELRSVKDILFTYEVEFNRLPEVRVGDYINIVDDSDEIYLSSRVLKLETSVLQNTVQAELGEFVRQTSGISERLSKMADELRKRQLATTDIKLTSSEGDTFTSSLVNTVISVVITYSDNVITNYADLVSVFGDDVELEWYKDDTRIYTTTTHVISNDGFTLTLIDEEVNDVAGYEVRLVTND